MFGFCEKEKRIDCEKGEEDNGGSYMENVAGLDGKIEGSDLLSGEIIYPAREETDAESADSGDGVYPVVDRVISAIGNEKE